MTGDLSIQPLEEAIARLGRKLPVASFLRTQEWADVPLALRERAQFSAGITKLDIMQGVQDKLQEWVTMGRDNPDRSTMDKGKFVAEMRQLLGAEPGDSGQITDITSRRRLELIFDWQTQDAMEYGRWQIGQDQEILDAFPAQEFLRIESRIEPREDWPERWAEAGGKEYGGRMIATKDDPVWTKLSVFGRPWPPFDFGSGMGIEDIDREEAEELGVLTRTERVAPTEAGFNDAVEQDIGNLSPDKLDWLKGQFGDQIEVRDGKARWRGQK